MRVYQATALAWPSDTRVSHARFTVHRLLVGVGQPRGALARSPGALPLLSGPPRQPHDGAAGVDRRSVDRPRVSGLARCKRRRTGRFTRRFSPSPSTSGENDFGRGAKLRAARHRLSAHPGKPSALGRRGGSRSVALPDDTRSPPVTRARARPCRAHGHAPEGDDATVRRAPCSASSRALARCRACQRARCASD